MANDFCTRLYIISILGYEIGMFRGTYIRWVIFIKAAYISNL